MAKLPERLRQNKDKIMYLGLASGGLLAAGIKFNFITLIQLNGYIGWVFMAVSLVGLWTFNEGFIKMRQRKNPFAPPQGQPRRVIPRPSMADLGVGVGPAQVEEFPQSPAVSAYERPPEKTKEDIFAEFNQ